MQSKVEHCWGTTFRWGVLALVFLAGIISALGSMPITSIPPAQIDDKSVKQLQEQTDQLEKDLNAVKQDLARETDPDARAMISNLLTEKQQLLEHNKTYLENVKRVRAGGTCFPADMRVMTESGAKPIGEIQIGDKVLSVDADGRRVAAEVLKTYADRNRHYYLINGSIKVTGRHRFFTDKGWKPAKELTRGDRIQNASGVFEEIAAIEWVPADDLAVFNLTIAENHNFFVSPDGQNGYLVHNTSGGGGK